MTHLDVPIPELDSRRQLISKSFTVTGVDGQKWSTPQPERYAYEISPAGVLSIFRLDDGRECGVERHYSAVGWAELVEDNGDFVPGVARLH